MQHKMDELCPGQQVAYHATSSSLVPNISMPTLDFRNDCNLEEMDPSFGQFNASIQYNNAMVDSTDPYSFFKGLPFNGYPCGASSLFTAVNRENIPSPMGMKLVGEMVLCPEQDSTITTCSSGGGFSDFGSFNNERFSDSTLQMPHLLHRIPEVPSTLPSLDLMYHQPYGQAKKPSEARVQYYFSGNNQSCNPIAEKITFMQTQLPQEPSYGVLVSSESSALSFSSKTADKHSRPSNILCFSLKHKILSAYINYKSSVVPTWDSKVSFVNYLHSTMCNRRRCGCEIFCKLLSHFDECNSSECHICGPVQYLFDSGNFHKYDNMKMNFCDRDSGQPMSGSSDSLLPSLKRLKMENLAGSFSPEVGIPRFFDPLKVQPSYSGTLLPSQQWPESPISINSEAKEVNMELLRNPVNSTIDREIGNSVNLMLNFQGMISPKELIVGCKTEEINTSSGSEIAENILDSNRLKFSAVPVLHEELGAVCEEGEVLVRTKLNQTHPEIENDSVAAPSTPKSENGNKTTHIVIENSCQLCGVEKLLLTPTPIYCSSCCACIKRNVIYYSTPEENGMQHCFCTSCYKASRGGKITLYDITISKAKMDKRKNNEATEEAWVLCDKCDGWQHQICALFNNKSVPSAA